MKESFELSKNFNASPEVIYQAWLSSEGHTAMTGGEAICGQELGETFTAWDGYIVGKNLELNLNQRILQSWRTSEFEDSDDDSILEVVLETSGKGTKLTLKHSNIPEGQTQYVEGWKEHYFNPMEEYFGE